MLVFEDAEAFGAFGSTITNLYWQVHHKIPAIIFSPWFVCFQPWLHAAFTAVRTGQICQVNEAVYRSSAKSGLCAGLGHLWLTPLSFFPCLLPKGKMHWRDAQQRNRFTHPEKSHSHVPPHSHAKSQNHSRKLFSTMLVCHVQLRPTHPHTPCGPWAAMTGMAGRWWLVGNEGLLFESQWWSVSKQPRRTWSGSWGLWVNASLQHMLTHTGRIEGFRCRQHW